MADIAFFVGGLIPTLMVSRALLWWVFKTWDGGIRRLIVVHVFSLLVISLVAGSGMADGGAFAGAQAAGSYFLPQLVWFIVDTVMFRRKKLADLQNSN